MKRLSRGAFLFSLLGGAAVIVSIFVAPGCTTWHNEKFGDAKLKHENFRFRNLGPGVTAKSRDSVSFPEVALDVRVTNVVHVRRFPTNQSAGAFMLELPNKSRPPPQRNKEVLPWHQARIHLLVRDLAGHDLFEKQFALDNLPWWRADDQGGHGLHYEAKPTRRWWNDAWKILGLAEALAAQDNYDLIIVVEEPSTEKGNTIRIRGERMNWPWQTDSP